MRLEGWEARLAAVIEDARERPYVLGEHDCFRIACAAIEALTGIDRWPEWVGRYRTKPEARALIAQYGRNFAEAFDWFFGSPHLPAKLARRGDVLAFATSDGERHLGVCTGPEVAVLGETGLLFVPVAACLCCWRVG